MTPRSVAPAPAAVLLTPLPPEPTGVADSGAALLPALARRLDLVALTREPARSATAAAGVPLGSYRELPSLVARLPIYQLGNHAGHHAEIYRLALRHPGVVVLHEHVLHDLVRDCALADGGARAYAEELRYALGRSGERLAAVAAAGGERPSAFAWPLFERVVDRSLAVVVHSEEARARILRSRPLARVHRAALPTAPPPDPAAMAGAAAALRRELEIPASALVIGMFGVAASAKRIEAALRSFARLGHRRDHLYLLVVGTGSRGYVTECGALPDPLAPRLRALDRVPLERLLQAMAATDIALNLRHPTGGEASGTCLQLLGLGRAVVVSEVGWFTEIPDSCCAKVKPDALEPAMLDAMLEGLAASADLRRRLGDNGREWVLATHAQEAAADAYAAAAAAASATRREGVREPRPPLAPQPERDLDTELMASLGAALCDLGVTEADQPVLARIAERAAELGIGGRWRLRSPGSDRGRGPA